MPQTHIIDTLIDHLEGRKRTGQKGVCLSAENQSFLQDLLTNPTAQPRQQDPPPAPTPTPQPMQYQQPAPQPAQPQQPAAPTPQQPAPQVQEAEQPYMPQNVPSLDLSGSSWEDLETMIPPCSRCQLCTSGRRQTVMEDGDRCADLMFIGEGPGADEDREGVPFVGEAGKLLTSIINAMGFDRQDVYIANIVKCRPPRNRNPEPEEAAACLPYLERQIELVQPKVIVTLGAVPLQFLMDRRGITKNRGRWLIYKNVDVMPTFHPAFLARKPEAKREVWEDMKQVMAKLGKTPPPRSGDARPRQ